MIVVFSLNEDKTLGNHPILYIPTDLREQSLFFFFFYNSGDPKGFLVSKTNPGVRGLVFLKTKFVFHAFI